MGRPRQARCTRPALHHSNTPQTRRQKKARSKAGFSCKCKAETLLLAPAAFHVGFADDFSVRNGADASADLDRGALRFHRGLRGSRLFTPEEYHFGTDLNVCINGTQRQTAALVVAVAGE